MATLFAGDGIGENTKEFLKAVRRHVIRWEDDEKLEYFELSLKPGSRAESWYNKLPAAEKNTFENVVTAFQKQWPQEEMEEKERGELKGELLSLVLPPEDVGVRTEEDGISEWGHVRWAAKVARLAARIEDDGRLIPQALKNIPASFLPLLGPKRTTWRDLVQTMKDVPLTVAQSFRLSYHDNLAEATIRRWRNNIVPGPQLPEVLELSSTLKKPLPEDQKIPIPDPNMLVTGPDDCTEDDARLLFRGGGGFSRLIHLYCAIISSTPEADTEHGFIHFWDSNIRVLLHILFPEGRTSRNSSHGTQTAAFRPDFAFLYQNICPFRGEEKPPLSLDNPKAELSDKLSEPWPYPEAPYVLGYHAKGPILTLAAISPTEGGQTVVTDLATYNLRRRKDRIKHMVALINMAPLLRYLADLVPAVDAEFTEIERSTCVLEILGKVVLKTFTGSLDIRQTRMDHLDKIYILLGQKSVPHTDKLLHFIPDEHKIILHPRGDARGPKTEDELLDAVICVLEMLEVLHKPPTFIHRDLRWPNIIRSLKDRREWFVIDWSDAVETPARAENKRNFDPRTHCPRLYLENHGTEVDLWSVGELVLTSKVHLISSWLSRFGRSLKETPVTAAEALREIQNLRDRHRLQNTVVQAPPSPQLDASSVLVGEKRKAREECEESVATKRVNL